MEIFEKTWNKVGELHHAYFLVGNIENTAFKLKKFLEDFVGIKSVGNPDFWHLNYNVLTIDEARTVSSYQEEKSFSVNNGKKIFLIQTNSITEQAQNALLKIFEEPTKNTHFFILMPQDTLLPTLRSRLNVVLIENVEDADGALPAQAGLLQKPLAERLALVKSMTDDIKDEKKTKQDAINLLNKIESELHSNADGALLQTRVFDVCQLTRRSLNDNGAPIKMILENLMLSI